MRSVIVWIPDFPVIAAGLVLGVDVHLPVAVLREHRVAACSPAARAAGVRAGHRKRDAQGMCPDLILLDHDPARDAVAFEPIVAAVENLAAGVEVIRPGVCGMAAKGPARWYGGEAAAGEKFVDHLATVCGVEAQIGIADTLHTASLAALTGAIVEPGTSAAFLSPLDVAMVGVSNCVGLLRRLGITTLGALAALPVQDVAARFGLDGMVAHAIASGRDVRALAPRTPPADLGVERAFDEPLQRVDTAAFAARALAEELHDRLTGHGLACTRLVIEADTTDGQELHRVWRHDALLSVTDVSDRVRWQLDGWLTRRRAAGHEHDVDGPDEGGIIGLRLAPEGIVTASGLQLGLWGGTGEGRDQAHRAAARLQGILGSDAVVTAVATGGRAPGERIALLPWGDERTPDRPADRPWPGALPAPHPSFVHPTGATVTVLDQHGQPVSVTGRAAVSAEPRTVRVDGRVAVEVIGWAGPLPVDDRWWDGDVARRVARLQVLLADGRALLLTCAGGAWQLEATYD